MAGNLNAVGYHDLIFGPMRIDATPKGTTTHFTVTCDQIGPLITYYNYVLPFGATVAAHGFDVGHDGVTTAEEKYLEVSVPGLINNLGNIISELYFDQWELLTNENTASIFENPLIVGTPYSTYPLLNYNDKVVLSRLSRDGGSIKDAVASCNVDADNNVLHPPTVGTGPFGGGAASGSKVIFQVPGTLMAPDAYGGNAAQQIWLEILKDQKEYERPTYVLRHTSYCSAAATYNASTQHTQQIYSTPFLLSECGSGWTYNLPNRIYTKISGLTQAATGIYAAEHETPYYTWGWLKKITREPVLSNFIVEVSTEYELGLWSNLRYKVR